MRKSSKKSTTKSEDLVQPFKNEGKRRPEFGRWSKFLENTVSLDEAFKKRKSYYKAVAGRKKLSPGKKARAENKGSTDFEREIIQLIDYLMQGQEDSYHAFRSPASKTPVDVWRIDKVLHFSNASYVRCYQCKTTRDTSPPKIDKKEFIEFVKFVNKIGAEGFWADRWKKNKNVYIRRIRGVHRDGSFHSTIYEDFSYALKKAESASATSPVDKSDT